MINVLDKQTRELIAAGEVVERPASAVKELLENAVDAGAARVSVELVSNGLKSITVTDDGCGIPYGEIETAFLRHATSKISSPLDLESIGTLGFRGEALPSIASVSRVTLRSKTRDEDDGGEYRCEGGENAALCVCGCPDGTSISVEDIFFNTPARMKFLKKDVSEGNAVEDAVEQQALAHPEISFRLLRDGKQTVFTPGDGRLLSAAYAVLPDQLASMLLPVEGEKEGIRVSGLISAPEASRASRAFQYFFVNGRYIKNRTCTAAAEEAYRGLSGHRGFPALVLQISLSPDRVDVNVHPAKTEVRFADERRVFSAVYAAVRGALDEFSHRPLEFAEKLTQETDAAAQISPDVVLTLPKEDINPVSAEKKQPDVPAFGTCARGAADISSARGIVDFFGSFDADSKRSDTLDCFEQPSFEDKREYLPEKSDAKTAYVPSTVSPNTVSLNVPAIEKTELQYVGELFKTYIIASFGNTAVVIDKHAAHERILFEKLAALDVTADRQLLLEPVTVELSAEEKRALLENCETVEKAGFLVEDFGERTVIVREVPTFFKPAAVKRAVEQFASQLSSLSARADSSDTKALLRSIACREAVKSGDEAHPQQLMNIAQQIIDGSVPRYCPHGRPVLFLLEKSELEKRFERD